MSDPYEFVPPFFSPLTHDQHARLGRIAVLWGQIDMILDQLLQAAMGLTGKQLRTFGGEKPIGVKLGWLGNHMDDLHPQSGRDLAQQFATLADETKNQRNRCFHGVWGFRPARGQRIVAAASHFKEVHNPVTTDDLPALEKKLCRTARVGTRALVELGIFSADNVRGCNRLFNGPGDDPPGWLSEWSAEHPVDDSALDSRHKLGQLPFLKEPL